MISSVEIYPKFGKAQKQNERANSVLSKFCIEIATFYCLDDSLLLRAIYSSD